MGNFEQLSKRGRRRTDGINLTLTIGILSQKLAVFRSSYSRRHPRNLSLMDEDIDVTLIKARIFIHWTWLVREWQQSACIWICISLKIWICVPLRWRMSPMKPWFSVPVYNDRRVFWVIGLNLYSILLLEALFIGEH